MTRLVIADPNTASRKALALLLSRKLGIVLIEEVEDAESLIRSLSERACDVLLLDWHLYGASVPETCHLLRKTYPGLKIVLLSVDSDNRQAAWSAGASFVHKGASPETVIATLEPLLGLSHP